MAMRLEARFARPLSREDKLAFAAIAATMAKVRAVRFLRGERGVAVIAEELGRVALIAALAEVGLTPETVLTSLADDARCDEAAGATDERLKAPGR